MPTPRLQPFITFSDGEKTALRLQSNVSRSLRSIIAFLNDSRMLIDPANFRMGLLAAAAQAGVSGGQILAALDASQNASIQLRDNASNLVTLFASAFPGLSVYAKSGNNPILDIGRSGATDWRLSQNSTNDFTLTPFNAGVGKKFDVQAPIASSTGSRSVLKMGSLCASGGQTYANTGPLNVAWNNTGGAAVSRLNVWTPSFAGSIVAVSAYLNGQAIPASSTLTVNYQRNGGAFSTLATWTNANGSGTSPSTSAAKNAFPFAANDSVNLAITTSYSCTAYIEFTITIELDPR